MISKGLAEGLDKTKGGSENSQADSSEMRKHMWIATACLLN